MLTCKVMHPEHHISEMSTVHRASDIKANVKTNFLNKAGQCGVK